MTHLTGFCTPGNPPASHGHCSGSYTRGPTYPDRVACECECHEVRVPEPSSVGVPGFHEGIPEADYHADRTSLSHSGVKTILQAPAIFRHQQDHPVTKRVFDLGSAAHRLVLGAGEPIVVVERTDTKTGEVTEAEDYKTPSARAHAEQIRAEHGIPLLRKEYDAVQAMADVLSSHSAAMELLSVGTPEVSAYAPDEATGVLRRCRYDWLGPSILTDYKTAESADPFAFGRKAADYGYHIQAAWYLDVAADLGHPAEAFAFVVQAKTPPYLVTVIELVPAAIQRGRDLAARGLQMYRDCTEAGLWPGYVPDDTKSVVVNLPEWAYTDRELETSS